MTITASPVPTANKASLVVVSPIVSHPMLLSDWDGGDGEIYAQMVGANPLKTDPELKRRLAELPRINTRKDFARWRTSFLERYECFLEQEGTGKAQPAYDQFRKELTKLNALTSAVKEDLPTTDRISVEGDEEPTFHVKVSTRRRLAEWNKQLGRMALALTALTPCSLELEKACGYTKFQLGALLVRDGFAEYNVLAVIEETCDFLREQTCLSQIADRQVMESILEYQTKLAIFCDIMADLGLYQAMLKCHEINQLSNGSGKDNEEEEDVIVNEGDNGGERETKKKPDPQPQQLEETPPLSADKGKEKKSKTRTKKKKEKSTESEPANPYTFKLSFPAPKPPSSAFIKYVETNATSMDEVATGIHPRGTLQGRGDGSRKGIEYDWDDGSCSKKGLTREEAEEEAYKPVARPNFQYGYHGGKNPDAWRITNGRLPTSSSGYDKKMTKLDSSDDDDDKRDSDSDSDSTTS